MYYFKKYISLWDGNSVQYINNVQQNGQFQNPALLLIRYCPKLENTCLTPGHLKILQILKFRIFKIKKNSNVLFFKSRICKKVTSDLYLFSKPSPPLFSFSFVHFSQNPSSLYSRASFMYQNSKKNIIIQGNIQLTTLISLFFRNLVCISHSLCMGIIDSRRVMLKIQR